MIGNLRATLCLLILLGVCRSALSQVTTAPAPQGSGVAGTGAVTGVVKFGDAPAPGITLALLPERMGRMGPQPQSQPDISNRVVTNEKGEYRFTNVEAGRFRVAPLAEAYVITSGGTARGGAGGIAVTVSDGQTASDIDLTLARGGVIPGRGIHRGGTPGVAGRIH